jgi:glycosyltransferase involved in cell wall biosynthesis
MTNLCRLSVTIATKNEGENLLKCLSSVPFADEIVIVDDCSTDDTVVKARQHGAQIIVRDSEGSFHENKNLAIEQAKGDWILSLDADEVVTARLADSIKSAVTNPKSDGYLVDRHNYFLGQWIRGCGWYPDHILRLFKKGKAWWPLMIHDTPKLEGGNQNAFLLEGPLIHYSYTSFEQYFEKFNAYTSRLATEYAKRNERIEGLTVPLNLFIRPSFWFVKKYLFSKGYRDGLLGLFIGFSSALTIFVSYMKLWQAQKGRAQE